jgi:hypothetical protein
MDTIVLVPSFWVLPYLIGIIIGFYLMVKTYKDMTLIFLGTTAYLLALTIGLRLYYGS